MMHLVLGATGRVGRAVAESLVSQGEAVRVIVRSTAKAKKIYGDSVDIFEADYANAAKLVQGFRGGDTAFLLTPENPFSENPLKETEALIAAYQEAVFRSKLQRLVLLSTFGADIAEGGGNLEMSNKLEAAFKDSALKTIILRGTYYFSNFDGYFELAREAGILPTYFPVDFKLPMIAPSAVGSYVAKLMTGKEKNANLIKLIGSKAYSPADIAQHLTQVFDREIHAVTGNLEDMKDELMSIGFSKEGAEGLYLMTKATLEGRTKATIQPTKIESGYEDYLTEIGLL